MEIEGKRFNHWTVLSFSHKKGSHFYYNCKCDCGTEKIIQKYNLVNNRTKSCGCNLDLVGTTVNGINIVRCVHNSTFVFECPYCGNEFTNIYSRVASGHVSSCGCRSKQFKSLIGQKFGKLTVVKYLGIKNTHSYWLCKCDCGNYKEEFGYVLTNGSISSCGCVSINFSGSSIENEIKSFLLELNPNLEITKKKCLNGKEIDIYMPSLNLGIEYNGSAFHASIGNVYNNKVKTYHRDKFLLAKEKGIHLITIFDYDWYINKDKIKMYLRDLILSKKVVYARSCVVESISKVEAISFTEVYHLQGSAKLQNINYGLYYHNELISVMSFGKPRYKNKGFELQRYCVKGGYTIVGGANKLLKKFENDYQPKELISYSNNDYFTGDIYNILGFSFDSYTDIDYYWASNSRYYKRSECQPKILKVKYKDLYEEAVSNKANSVEVYVMLKLKARKVYRCGNTRWIKRYNI